MYPDAFCPVQLAFTKYRNELARALIGLEAPASVHVGHRKAARASKQLVASDRCRDAPEAAGWASITIRLNWR